MEFEDNCNNFTEMKISIATKFKEQLVKDKFGEEDFTEETERSFHRAILTTIEEYIFEDREEFVESVLSKMSEDIPMKDLKIEDFSDLGKIFISLDVPKECQNKKQTKEKMLDNLEEQNPDQDDIIGDKSFALGQI